MQTAQPYSRRGDREVQPLAIQALGQRRIFKLRLAPFQRRFKRLLRGVQLFAKVRAFCRRELSHFTANARKRALAAQHFHADRFQFVLRLSFPDARERARFQFG